MTFSTTLLIVLGIPLILLFLGFFLICLGFYRSRSDEEATMKTLALAQDLQNVLDKLEVRMNNLEDIILGPEGQKGGNKTPPSPFEASKE